MSDSSIAVFRSPQPRIRRVPLDQAWVWLGAGWRDLWAGPANSMTYGIFAVLAGWLAVSLLLWLDLPYLVLPLTAGFFFLGPFMAVGLYETSRRRERGLPIDLAITMTAWKRNPDQILLMAVVLLLFHLAWMRVAQLLFALFDFRSVPSWERFSDLAWHSTRSLPFLAVGVGIGAILAGMVFAIGAFSMPYLLDRRNANL